MHEGLTQAIIGMASADSEVRVASATEIYRTARALADHATYPWWTDQELSELLGGTNPHVTAGLAVTAENFEKIREAGGSPRLADVPADQDAREFELHLPGGLSVDILTSSNPAGTGAIAKYLQKFGEGVQQIEYKCKDVDRATQILRERFGMNPVYPATRPGAGETRINFFLVTAPNAGKVLIELYEPAQTFE